MTLKRWEVRFIAWARRQDRAESTLKAYRCWWRRFEAFLEEREVEPRDVTRSMVTDFLATLTTLESHRGRPYSASTRVLVVAWLRLFYRFMLEEGLIVVDPTRGLPRSRQGRILPRAVLTPQEMRRLLAVPDVTDVWGLRDRAILELLYGSGIRFAEMAHLGVGDVDLVERVLWVRQGKGRRDRVLPLGRWATHWLARYLKDSDKLRRDQGTDRVFLTPRGERISNWVLNLMLRRHAAKAGITKKITAHALRHTFATQLIQGGADVRKIQRLLGHVQLSTTQVYTHLDLADLRKVQDECHPREKRRR